MAKKNNKKESQKVLIITYVLIGLFSVFTLFFLVNQTVHFFKNSELFKIREIVKDPALPSLDMEFLARLKGHSIFAVDLKAVERRLQMQFPQVDQLRVLRKFPDRIYVVAKTREPAAILSIRNQDVLLAQDGFVLAMKSPPSGKLPMIVGSQGSFGIAVGRPVESAQVQAGLDVIKNFYMNRRLATFGLTTVDVSNLSKITCVLTDGLNIIVDQERLIPKFQTLEFLLTEGKLNLHEISYIDLRFKEPVLGKKTK